MIDKEVISSSPESDEFKDGCRKEKNVSRFYDRTAGIICMVRPCLIRLGLYEVYVNI